jgi:hypothetical protein
LLGYEIEKNPDGTVTLTLSSSEDISGQSINITVNPANSGNPIFSKTLSAMFSIPLTPSDSQDGS